MARKTMRRLPAGKDGGITWPDSGRRASIPIRVTDGCVRARVGGYSSRIGWVDLPVAVGVLLHRDELL